MALPERDPVSQVYLGLLDIGPTGEWLRRRIDWMVDEVRGPLVLDVGCSEGILEVLLARRGLTVTGVDVDPDTLDFARLLLAKEPDEVRERVRFVQGDFIGDTAGEGPLRHRGDGGVTQLFLTILRECWKGDWSIFDREEEWSLQPLSECTRTKTIA